MDGKRIFVTGGGTGLGKSMGQRFAELGADLVICGRRLEPLQETAAEFEKITGRKVETYSCDVRSAESIETLLDAIWSRGSLTGIVNNAADWGVCAVHGRKAEESGCWGYPRGVFLPEN